MKQNKEYYLVKDVVAANDGVLVADSNDVLKDIPVDAANVIDGVATDGNYRIYKLVEGETAPTGDKVVVLSSGEARLAVQSSLFNLQPTTEFVKADFAKCDQIRAAFMAAQSGLGVATAETMLDILTDTSIALSTGSLVLAYTRFNDSNIDATFPGTTAAFNPEFWDCFTKFPRDLS